MKSRGRKCKNPEKTKFPTREAAERFLRNPDKKFTGMKPPIEAYPCGDHFHVTSNMHYGVRRRS